ncbi:YcaO-like family protein [Halobacteriovorax sp. DA5]|uniref:YcaO-like family protein n=1 Tax=Halobacteriovorax sp. DA5 TaxID=2067553 RepID=UPI000CD2FB83|nr:YcaO-like family protein [Halobacteriovorax sp. DA5]POB14823.1 hypothetical protein C0Z22_00180 [Halobacteriovorax sp. DA5]
MDDYKELNKWILAHSKSLDLQVERLNWVKNWLPEYHDFRVTGSVSGHRLEGRGTDRNEEIAFYKSFSELIERMYCFALNINSNGVAAHVNKSKAIENAKLELLERDAVLCHHHAQTPFRKPEDFDLPCEFKEIRERLKNEGITLALATTKAAIADCHVAVCHASGGDRFGGLYGFGCNENINDSFESALLECLINVVAHLDGNLDLLPLSPNDLYEKKVPNGLDHKRVHFAHKLFELKADNYGPVTSLETEENIFEIKTLEAPIPIFDDLPLHVMRAISSHLQDIYYGRVEEHKINLARLNIFAGRELSLGMLAMVPHPIG